jgi:ankyrin repeat protein
MHEFLDAIRRGDTLEVTRLLDRDPALASAVDDNGVSAVSTAMYNGQRDIARLLIERGARLSFHDACAAGEAGLARQMLEADPSLLDRRSADGYPPLGLAIFFGHRQLAKDLIAAGADVNAAAGNAQRVAPLHAAAAVRDHELLRMLLERGADPNARQQLDYTPLHTAASRGDVEMAKMLIAAGADTTVKASDGAGVADVARKYGQEEFARWIDRRP